MQGFVETKNILRRYFRAGAVRCWISCLCEAVPMKQRERENKINEIKVFLFFLEREKTVSL